MPSRPTHAGNQFAGGRRRWRLPAAAILTLVAGCRCFNYDREGAISPELAQCRHYTHLSIAALERGDVEQAERLSSQAVEAFPNDAQARRGLADALWRRGKATAAIDQLEIARKISPDEPTLLVQLGEMYLALDQWEAARTLAADSLDADPSSARAWLLRGDTFRAAGRFDEALADYTRASGMEPANPLILRRLSVVSLARREPQRALSYARSLVDAYSPSEPPADALDLYGEILADLGRWTDAKDAYTQAAAAQATPERLCRLAEAELLAGEPNAARHTLDRVLASHPQHLQGLALRSRMNDAAPRRK
ncbi:MAG: tetratricopeptide repeat protein [Pirellulales bacterium]